MGIYAIAHDSTYQTKTIGGGIIVILNKFVSDYIFGNYYDDKSERAIQRYLETAIAKSILRGEFQGGDTIFVDVEDERLTFKRLSVEMLA